MEEEWIKVKEIQRVSNLVKEKRIIDFVQREWKELLDQFKIKYKFDIVLDTEYIEGIRSAASMNQVYILSLYTVKEDLEQMKRIIFEYENAQSEIPEELRDIDEEEEHEELKPMKVSKYFFNILIILLIILEISLVIVSKESSNSIDVDIYILIAILIIVELYLIIVVNKKKRKE